MIKKLICESVNINIEGINEGVSINIEGVRGMKMKS